jgi:hypothetical protein
MSQHVAFQRYIEMITECCGKDLHKSGGVFHKLGQSHGQILKCPKISQVAYQVKAPLKSFQLVQE